MSSSIPIPRRSKKAPATHNHDDPERPSTSFESSSASSSSSSPYRSSFSTPQTPQSASSSQSPTFLRDRRPSLLSESISRTEHIVINVGQPDAPRLISCVKTSQGFDWNPDIFLPSYAADYHHSDLERRQEPVQDIILTDEEIRNMLPQ